MVVVSPDTLPVNAAESSSLSVPVEPAAKLTFSADAAANSRVAAPEIVAVPFPVTAPLKVILPPSANRLPELSTALLTISPPVPVASRIPELVMTLLPVSRTSALVPVASIVPSLTSVICPSPSCPAPEMVLSTLVNVTLGSVPKIAFALLSDSVSCAAALQRDAVLDQLEIGLVAGRIERDRAGVVDDAAERQHGAVADHHVAGVVGDRRLIEHEVVRGER